MARDGGSVSFKLGSELEKGRLTDEAMRKGRGEKSLRQDRQENAIIQTYWYIDK